MHEKTSSPLHEASKMLCVLAITACVVFLTKDLGFNFAQITSTAVFTLIISATLFFWDFHLPIAFVGIGLLLMLNVMDINRLIAKSHLDVILFLIGMMVIIGVLRELGLFSWIIISVITIDRMNAKLFCFIACVLGAVMSCIADEVTSIVFVAALIFQVCDTLNLKPVPFIIMAVMAVNIGSTGTMLGNPVCLLIGQSANPPLSFNDFMVWSFPLMLAEFAVVFAYMQRSFRREIQEMDECLKQRRDRGLSLGPIVQVPFRKGLFILALLIGSLCMHTYIENWLGLNRNTVLIMTPILLSGLLMLWRREQVRHYIESDVEWITLIFFMMLFVVAGTLEHTKVTTLISSGFVATFGDEPAVLLPVILSISALGSAFIENMAFVAAFLPVVLDLEQTPLLWAFLHGSCLGGNITMMGSTANIAAVSMLEKRYWTKINFFTWLKTGLMVGLLSCLVNWIGLAILSPYMPTHEERIRAAQTASVDAAGNNAATASADAQDNR